MQRKGGVKKSHAEERVGPQRPWACAWAGVALPGGRSAQCCRQWQLRRSSGWAAWGAWLPPRASGDEAEKGGPGAVPRATRVGRWTLSCVDPETPFPEPTALGMCRKEGA